LALLLRWPRADGIASAAAPATARTTRTATAAAARRTLLGPDTGLTSLAYDPNGNLVSQTDAGGTTTITEYDALDRPRQRYTLPLDAQAFAELTYDRDSYCYATPRPPWRTRNVRSTCSTSGSET
jgi:YD repeat-containing protein